MLAQTERDWELLLIDNNCRERPLATLAVSAEWRGDPRVRIVRPDVMRNAAVARNAGIAVARGVWVSYLDDDDAWRPEKLARQLALARRSVAPLVLCGATFHLDGRVRNVQCKTTVWRGDDLLLGASWGTPLLFHRRADCGYFDGSLGAGEDAEFAHRVMARAGATEVLNVPEPLVDIFPQPGPRVNVNFAPLRSAAARILALRPGFYSRRARRRYVLRTLLAVAKLRGQPARCTLLVGRLLLESRGADWRVGANALAVTLGLFPTRWVS